MRSEHAQAGGEAILSRSRGRGGRHVHATWCPNERKWRNTRNACLREGGDYREVRRRGSRGRAIAEQTEGPPRGAGEGMVLQERGRGGTDGGCGAGCCPASLVDWWAG